MDKKKVGFASSIGFILASAGSAVGLGNLWGFPYKAASNGGAAFVLIYIGCVLFIGFITMLTEMFIGKRAQANPVTAFKKASKNMGWVGVIVTVIPFLICCYYSVLGGWTTKYALNSFTGNAGIIADFSTNVGEVVLYTVIFMALVLVIIMAGVGDGIEKMSKVLMPTLFIILVGVACYSLCLGDGVEEGLNFYLKPDFSSVTFKTVLAAMGQAFFSLSLGMGAMVTYGSYTGKEINIGKSAAMVCLFDTVAALLAGFAIFPAVAHFDPSLLSGAKGVGLMYITLPMVFDSMGVVGQIVSFLFFAMVVIAALTSIMSLVEVVTQFVIQRFHFSRKKSAMVVIVASTLLSIPVGISLGRVAICEVEGPNAFGIDWLTFLDEITNTVLMPVAAFLACVVVGWFIKPKKAIAELEEQGTKLGFLAKIYPVFVKFITPALIVVVEIGGIKGEFDQGMAPVVYCAYALLAVCVVVYFAFFKKGETGTNEDEKLLKD